jgi:hypothetical protein
MGITVRVQMRIPDRLGDVTFLRLAYSPSAAFCVTGNIEMRNLVQP